MQLFLRGLEGVTACLNLTAGAGVAEVRAAVQVRHVNPMARTEMRGILLRVFQPLLATLDAAQAPLHCSSTCCCCCCCC